LAVKFPTKEGLASHCHERLYNCKGLMGEKKIKEDGDGGKEWLLKVGFPYLENSNFMGFLPVLVCPFPLSLPLFISEIILKFTQPCAKCDCRT